MTATASKTAQVKIGCSCGGPGQPGGHVQGVSHTPIYATKS